MSEEPRLDVIIIGAGPAGLSAAIWSRDLGLDAIVLEKGPEPGGQLLSIYNPIGNYPGLEAANGREVRDRFLETATHHGVDILVSTEVVEIDTIKTSVLTNTGQRYTARSIILATGVRRRRLNIPGETEFAGKGMIESGSRDRESVRGKTVAIIGGGDAALENAMILANYAAKVYVIHRRGKFSAREEFVEAASRTANVEFIFDSKVEKINGSEGVASIEIVSRGLGRCVMPVNVVLPRIGVEPNSELLRDKAEFGRAGYVLVDHLGRAIESRLYAVGDVANEISPTIATAVGTGAAAVKALRCLYPKSSQL